MLALRALMAMRAAGANAKNGYWDRYRVSIEGALI